MAEKQFKTIKMKKTIFLFISIIALAITSCEKEGMDCATTATCFTIDLSAGCDRDDEGHVIPGTYRITGRDTISFDYSVCDTAEMKALWWEQLRASQSADAEIHQFIVQNANYWCWQ